MWNMILGQSIYQLIVVLTLDFSGDRTFGFMFEPLQEIYAWDYGFQYICVDAIFQSVQ
jgi:hypothetical protein